jgi:hypothetical protein
MWLILGGESEHIEVCEQGLEDQEQASQEHRWEGADHQRYETENQAAWSWTEECKWPYSVLDKFLEKQQQC